MGQVNFGESLKAAQEMRGISNRQLMDDFGVFRQQVHRWQNTPSISIRKAEAFAKYFGLSLFEFLKLGVKDVAKTDS